MNYKVQIRENISPGIGYQCKMGTHCKLSPQTLSSIVSVMISMHMYSSSTSSTSSSFQGSMGLASSSSDGGGGPSSLLAASFDSIVTATREFSGRSHLSAAGRSQTDSVSHLGREESPPIFWKDILEIGEKYGVDYSEVEILNRYRRAYGQPWGKLASGLLHDVGHGPFSHMFEREFLPRVLSGLTWCAMFSDGQLASVL